MMTSHCLLTGVKREREGEKEREREKECDCVRGRERERERVLCVSTDELMRWHDTEDETNAISEKIDRDSGGGTLPQLWVIEIHPFGEIVSRWRDEIDLIHPSHVTLQRSQ